MWRPLAARAPADLATAARLLAADNEIDPDSMLVLGPDEAMTASGFDAVAAAARKGKALAALDRALFDRGLLRLSGGPDGAMLYLRSDRIRDPNATGGQCRGTIGMSNFGLNAGFANQLFQYAFLKLYGLRHNAAVETPSWMGEEVYDNSARHPITRRRRMVKGDEWSVRDLAWWDAERPPVDVDFWGYFQNVPACWRPHRAFLRRLFEPRAQWRGPVERWLARHRPQGQRFVAKTTCGVVITRATIRRQSRGSSSFLRRGICAGLPNSGRASPIPCCSSRPTTATRCCRPSPPMRP